ncbi:ubiquinone biosynthesis O-methyltransferase [Daldinia loculata]|uniref:ubiquinone biosynthesis O-methyltransferase n=1 Tax=Daldinia loculata TaxID=103429 RepID=UPI0020C4E328|nr:ubiquinone biosynthesis O-methyltransferase [Daldinia loculata]KAI1651082.1 ubiquinone biosynthesis O-methyltransferase [Daldinia loculata]KAI2784245.1 ubiquinone biosynthesis O-methyltransferase [Daldinia loculata]
MPPRIKPALVRQLRYSPASPRPVRCIIISPSRSFSVTKASASASYSSPNSTSADSTFTTVSPDEVSHFNALASSWWDPQGPSRILHLMNPLRHDFIRSCRSSALDDPPPPSNNLKYLDIGCGGGIFAESAARLPTTASVTAIDPSPEVLSIAKAHAKRDPALQSKLTYINTPIEKLPVPSTPQDGYDIVSIFEVIEHVSNPAEFLDRCAPFVKPGGWLVLSTIARTWLSWVTTNLVAEDLLRIVPKGTHDWQKYINEEELKTHFLQNRTEWTEPRCMGVVYVPGLGWKEVTGSEKIGNYFFAVRKVTKVV